MEKEVLKGFVKDLRVRSKVECTEGKVETLVRIYDHEDDIEYKLAFMPLVFPQLVSLYEDGGGIPEPEGFAVFRVKNGVVVGVARLPL